MNIKELAKRAGVSSATVSRVLNNSGYVRRNTKKGAGSGGGISLCSQCDRAEPKHQ